MLDIDNLDEMNLHQLMIEKLSGIIQPDDERLLDQLILEDQALRKQWEELQDAIPNHQTLQYDMVESWEKLSAHRRRTQRKQRLLRISAAAMLAGILVAGLLLKRPAFKQQIAPNTMSGLLPQGLQLQLAGGRVIDLSNATATDAGKVHLANNPASRTLSYTDNGGEVSMNKLWVPSGLDYTLKLSDGSEIIINAATEIQFPFRFSGASRIIRIKGEAYCKIARDDARPFIVELPDNRQVQVLGTTFNVNTYKQDNQKISLVEGGVLVKSTSGKVVLKPGQQCRYSEGENEMAVHTFNTDELSWINGQFIMDNAPISELAEVIPRWFKTPVQLDNPEQAVTTHFTGVVFKNRPLEELLNILRSTTNCEYYYKQEILHIRLHN